MRHDIVILNERAGGVELVCACGWLASARSRPEAEHLAAEHEAWRAGLRLFRLSLPVVAGLGLLAEGAWLVLLLWLFVHVL